MLTSEIDLRMSTHVNFHGDRGLEACWGPYLPRLNWRPDLPRMNRLPPPRSPNLKVMRPPLGFRVQASGFGVQGSGFRVQGSGLGVYAGWGPARATPNESTPTTEIAEPQGYEAPFRVQGLDDIGFRVPPSPYCSSLTCRRWRSNPSGKCSQERLTRGTVTSTMRRAVHPFGCARCGDSAG